MKLQSKNFLFGGAETKEVVDKGVVRQILGYDDSIMMVKVWFDRGAVGYRHAHEHSQVTYVESGVFEFTVGDESKRLETGDSVYIAPNISHGATCQEAGVLLDVFSPAREDFLAAEQKT
jgi:quercetin dioxygenase-like cupin family protein